MNHGFGRIPSPPDERDYRMADAVRELSRLPRPTKTWHSNLVLDQGETPHCVGFSWAGWGISAPVEDPWGNAEGHFIYKQCKALDGDPGDGSTVRAGAQVMLDRQRIKTYYFAADVDEAAEYVARFGPVVLGTVWTQGMMRPSLIGKIIHATGQIVGGHAYLWIGVDKTYATLRNSWGTGWGKGGDARISLRDLRYIWNQGGEACAATERVLAIGGAR